MVLSLTAVVRPVLEICRTANYSQMTAARSDRIVNEGWISHRRPRHHDVDFGNGIISARQPEKKSRFGADLVDPIIDKLSLQFRLGFLFQKEKEMSSRG